MKFLKSVPLAILLVGIALIGFGATARAADAATPAGSQSLLDLLKPVYDAFAGGHYAYAAALGVVLAVALVKRYAGTGKFGAFVHGDLGGTLTALLAAGGGALASALGAPGAHLTLALMWSTLLVAFTAAGGYAALKNLLVDPVLAPLAAKAPTWLQLPLQLVLWIFDHGVDGATALANAQAAGAAAVAAKPAAGLAGMAGAPTEVK